MKFTPQCYYVFMYMVFKQYIFQYGPFFPMLFRICSLKLTTGTGTAEEKVAARHSGTGPAGEGRAACQLSGPTMATCVSLRPKGGLPVKAGCGV